MAGKSSVIAADSRTLNSIPDSGKVMSETTGKSEIETRFDYQQMLSELRKQPAQNSEKLISQDDISAMFKKKKKLTENE